MKQDIRVRPGTLISIDMKFYEHIALVTDNMVGGFPNLISLSETYQNVVEETWHRSVQGRRVKIYGEQGLIDPPRVIAKARDCIGKVPWRLTFNCEHFARWLHDLEIKSPELRKGVLKLALAATLVKLMVR